MKYINYIDLRCYCNPLSKLPSDEEKRNEIVKHAELKSLKDVSECLGDFKSKERVFSKSSLEKSPLLSIYLAHITNYHIYGITKNKRPDEVKSKYEDSISYFKKATQRKTLIPLPV